MHGAVAGRRFASQPVNIGACGWLQMSKPLPSPSAGYLRPLFKRSEMGLYPKKFEKTAVFCDFYIAKHFNTAY
jgi:hypothetical protein